MNEVGPGMSFTSMSDDGPIYALNGSKMSCNTCFKNNKKILSCGKCHRVKYCSRTCQEIDYKKHEEFCFKLLSENERNGECFIVSVITPPLHEWKWALDIAKEMILKRQIHPDDIYFNTAKAEECGMKCEFNNSFLMESLSIGDSETFEFLLKCGAASNRRIQNWIETKLKTKNYHSFKLHYTFIQIWLKYGFDISIQRGIGFGLMLRIDCKTVDWLEMWTYSLGVPASFVCSADLILSWYYRNRDENSPDYKRFYTTLYSLGIDTEKKNNHGESAMSIAINGEFVLSVKELQDACWIWKNRGKFTLDVLHNLVHIDLAKIVTCFISNEFMYKEPAAPLTSKNLRFL